MSANPEKFVVSGNGVVVGVDVLTDTRDPWCTCGGAIVVRAGNGPFECRAYIDSTRARWLAEVLVAAAGRVDGEREAKRAG